MRVWTLPLVLGILSVMTIMARAQNTVAVVDLEELIRLHPNTVADKKLLEETLKEFNAQKDELRQKVEETRREYESAVAEERNPALNEKARQDLARMTENRRASAMEAEREYGETVRSLQRQLTDQEVRMLKRTASEIEAEVAAYARKNGLQLVLQLPGRKMGAASGVIFAADALDITSAIMKQMGIDPPPPEQDDAVQVPAVQN